MPLKRNFDEYYNAVNKTVSTDFQNFTKKSFKVENLFTPTPKDDKYSVVLRFLPSHIDEKVPFIENKSHAKKFGDKWYVCDCLSHFDQKCPICEYNREQFKLYSDKETAKKYSWGKGRSKYVGNVLVVRNDNAPETEGKVFRFEYGTLVMGLIAEAQKGHNDPEAGWIEGFNVFDWKKGANFVLDGKKAGTFFKNDDSHFGSSRPINKWNGTSYVDLTDEEIDAVESQLYRLEECRHVPGDGIVKDREKIISDLMEKFGLDIRVGDEDSAPAKREAPAITKSEDVNIDIDVSSEKPAPKKQPKVEEQDPDAFLSSLLSD